MPVADLARVLLDTPRWVETRFMLLQNEAVITGLTGDRRHFVAASQRWPLVSVVGQPEFETDYILRCVAPDLGTFQDFVIKDLTAAPNVASVKTSLAIRRAKQEPGVPIAIPRG